MYLSFSVLFRSLSVIALLFFSVIPAYANQPLESFMWKASAAATAVLIAKTNPLKADRMSLETGGGDHFYIIRAGAEWDWNDNLLNVYGWNVDSYWQLDFSKWQSTRDASQSGANVTVGLTPMFRFTGSKGYVQPYLDVGVGVYLFTDSTLEDHEFGSNFQFSDLFRVGALIGNRNQWGIGYKFQHYSNGSVREPNKGINFHFITLSYKY